MSAQLIVQRGCHPRQRSRTEGQGRKGLRTLDCRVAGEGHGLGFLALSLCENHPEHSRSRGGTSVEMDPTSRMASRASPPSPNHCRVWGSRGTLHPGTLGHLP